MKISFRTAAVVAALGSMLIGGAASAATWNQSHSRRAEVNHRLANQNRRINQELRSGEISGAQAHKLHREDRMVRAEERSMASQRNGHITRAQKRVLNQQENGINRQIGQ